MIFNIKSRLFQSRFFSIGKPKKIIMCLIKYVLIQKSKISHREFVNNLSQKLTSKIAIGKVFIKIRESLILASFL